MPSNTKRKSSLYPSCGGTSTDHPVAACPLPPEVTARLKTFSLCHGRVWKSRLCDLWVRGEDSRDPSLRQARNLIGPSRLYKIKL